MLRDDPRCVHSVLPEFHHLPELNLLLVLDVHSESPPPEPQPNLTTATSLPTSPRLNEVDPAVSFLGGVPGYSEATEALHAGNDERRAAGGALPKERANRLPAEASRRQAQEEAQERAQQATLSTCDTDSRMDMNVDEGAYLVPGNPPAADSDTTDMDDDDDQPDGDDFGPSNPPAEGMIWMPSEARMAARNSFLSQINHMVDSTRGARSIDHWEIAELWERLEVLEKNWNDGEWVPAEAAPTTP